MDLLWEKENSETGPIYVNLFKNVDRHCIDRMLRQYERTKNSSPKDNRVSTEYRNKGNYLFAQKRWSKAMERYNDSLRFAETGSENVSLAIANRSTCFLELKSFEKCLIDIELAIDEGYPERLKPKLEKRRNDCLKQQQLAGQTSDIGLKLELSFVAHENYLGLANVLEIVYNERYGRHIIAKSDIDVGKRILIEEPFACQLEFNIEEILCETCMKKATNFIACDQCTGVMFCSRACLEKNNFHQMECGKEKYKNFRKMFHYILNALKMFPTAEILMKFVENAVADKAKQVPPPINDTMSKFREFLKLHVKEISPFNRNILLSQAFIGYQHLTKNEFVIDMFQSDQEKRFLAHLITHLSLVHGCNAFERDWDGSSFILASYFNHSCAPNVTCVDYGNLRIAITLRPIKKGQQVFVTYVGAERRSHSTKERREHLQKTFGFKCQCEMCSLNPAPAPRSTNSLHDLVGSLTDSLPDGPLNDKNYLLERVQKCIDLLNESGHKQWDHRMEKVANDYRTCLSKMYE